MLKVLKYCILGAFIICHKHPKWFRWKFIVSLIILTPGGQWKPQSPKQKFKHFDSKQRSDRSRLDAICTMNIFCYHNRIKTWRNSSYSPATTQSRQSIKSSEMQKTIISLDIFWRIIKTMKLPFMFLKSIIVQFFFVDDDFKIWGTKNWIWKMIFEIIVINYWKYLNWLSW